MTVRRSMLPVPTSARRRSAGDIGANMLEVVGLTIAVAAVLGGIAIGFGSSLPDGLSVAICKVLNGGDASQCETPSDEEFKPTCTMSQSSNSVGGKIEVAFFSVNADYALMKTTTYDPVTGEKTVKVTGIKGKGVGVGAAVGVDGQWGAATANASINAEAALKGSYGESWTFTGDDADAQADALASDVQEQYGIDAVKENGGVLGWAGGGIYDAVGGPEIPEPTVHTYEAELTGSLSGSLGAGLGTPGNKGKHVNKDDKGSDPKANVGVKAYASLDASEKVSYEVNDATGEESATYMLKFGGSMGANAGEETKQSEVEATGSVRITKGPDGKMSSVTLTSIQMVDGKATQTVTTIPTTSDAERQVVADKLANLEDPTELAETTAALTLDDFVQQEDPGTNGDPFQKLMYDKGKTSKVDYTYDKENTGYGASAKLGLKLGVGLSFADSSQSATDAVYLGAPGPNGNRDYMAYPECTGAERKKGKGVEKNGKPAP